MIRRRSLHPLFVALCMPLVLVGPACSDDGSVGDAAGTPADDPSPSEVAVDPDPLTFDKLDVGMDVTIPSGGVGQTVSVGVDGRPALVSVREFRDESTVVNLSVVPELVGLDMATYGDTVDRLDDVGGFVHSGTFIDAETAGLFGFLPATQGFPLTFDEFQRMRYIDGEPMGDRIEPVPASYGDLWDDDGSAPNDVPGEFVTFTFQGSRDLGGESARRYELTIDTEAADAAGESFDGSGYPVTIWVDENDVLRQVTSAPIAFEGGELTVEMSVIDLGGTPAAPPADARPFTAEELQFTAAPPDPLPADHQQLVDFSVALQAAIDAFMQTAPFTD